MTSYPQISRLGDTSILIQFEAKIEPQALKKILFYKNKLQDHLFEEKVEVINTYNSILISYLFPIEDFYSVKNSLDELLREVNISKNNKGDLFHIPVCYDLEFGLDLEFISSKKNIEIDEIIRLHTEPFYLIYFIGFLPGFLYLGGLNKKLDFARKETPRKLVEKGAVGIAGNQTGIYPQNSPGGWQILGKTPVELFNKNVNPPSPFSAGDRIKFYQVSIDEFLEIEEKVKAGTFKFKKQNDG